ncbi:MAG TPA: response regulator transcription factor [Anaerolineae bacterium]|nr:response regulator transcription factor [Anaerolineae bacterium]
MGETILVIEDDSFQAEVVEQLLAHNGFTPIIAMDGVEGLRRLYETQPDLVVLDLMLPHIDGWEVLRRIREMSTVPIIIMSSRKSDEEKIKGLRLGADDYIAKPFNVQELAARIVAVLRRTHMPPPPKGSVLRFAGGNLIIDPESAAVIIDGQPRELTPTEHQILMFMAQRPGQIISVEEIFSTIWGFESKANINNVKWYVWRLRQKMEANDKTPRFIFTERGMGYRFTTV